MKLHTPLAPTDEERDLLNLAAKAAGLSANLKWGPDGFRTYDPPTEWNPLTDDGDALRLAVRAGVQVSLNGHIICVSAGELTIADNVESDNCERLRLAIVRAAAEIGRFRP